MHGGVKVYRGAAAAARAYVEADQSRADDYYLAEGTGVAEHFTATPDGGVETVGRPGRRRRTRHGSPARPGDR